MNEDMNKSDVANAGDVSNTAGVSNMGDVDFDRLPGVRFGALAFDVDSGERVFAHNENDELDTASMGKVFLLHTALQMHLRGNLNLAERLSRRPSERVDESGIWYLMEQDDLSIYDVAVLVGAFSDNFATNVLIRRVGLENVARQVEDLGYRNSGLHDFLRWPRPAKAPRTLSTGTAAEISDFMARHAKDEFWDESTNEIFRRWLGAGADTSMVASAFDLDPLAHYNYQRDVWVWNKTGTNGTIRADAGLAMTPTRRVAYAVFANWETDTDRVVDVMPIMREAGEAIHRFL
ncbi:MAG: class A beta-lactamase-related serine hydrolase [Brevibacterium sp.]|nr:class A beta-lactamase-related serine hydrolase [Brevibacterium sp.]MDN5875239.1 class A beta-lactamase-related serine hydrolase [Brevibacterium sp.]MDN5910512.1 class A beta-lactamase-related serine hydrolase [Brevibacterium sp.]MDN6133810.1 class A beta-lactamase-related serine hydrolase [Brevibacterium sp.]MDN6156689.1 class A beta-lactamase-related serine hydrolase [Brevibacterium sp.]